MELLIYLAVILAVIALVGHGIWVLIAGFFRMLSSGGERPISTEMCPRCGALWNRNSGINTCALCGWPAENAARRTANGSRSALQALEKQIERYQQLGLIATETHDRLIRAIRDDPKPRVAPTLAPAWRERPVPVPVAEVEFLPVPEPVLEPMARNEAAGTRPLVPDTAVADWARSSRGLHDQEATPTQAPGPARVPESSQPLLTLLSAFLEQKNIRWGEIVGGLLIVGCSLALVLSFWSSIAERPLLKFGLFNGVTALVFALGLHAERRWRLPTTALGLLVIATLLIPLNLLAVASLSRGAVAGSAWGVAGEIVTVGLFAALTYLAGRSLVARAPAALALGVLLPSATMLLIPRSVVPGGGSFVLLLLGALPMLAQSAAVATLIVRVRREPEIDEPTALDLLRLLGLTSFALALALGLLLAHAGPIATALHRAAPLTPLVAVSTLATGLVLWRRTTAADLAGYRTAGTAIAASGVLLLLSGVLLSWPDPSGMFPVALLGALVLSAVAFAFHVPEAHVLVGVCLALAYVLGWHVATGSLGWDVATADRTRDALLSSRSGSALLPIVLGFGVATAVGQRLGRRDHAQAFALVAALAAAISLGLVTWFGFGRVGDPSGATWAYAVHALFAFSAAAWFGRNTLVPGTDTGVEVTVLGWAGSALLLATLVQGFVFGPIVPGLALPWVVAFLVHATLAAVSGAILASVRRTANHVEGVSPQRSLGNLLAQSSLATSILAAGALVSAVRIATSPSLALDLTWLAVVWLALAMRYACPALFAACQGALTGSVVFAVATWLEGRDWYVRSPDPWLDPWTLQAQAMALGVSCLAWIGLRLADRGPSSRLPAAVGGLLDPPWPSFDRWLRYALLLAAVVLVATGAWPGVIRELSPRDVAAPHLGGFHAHALGAGSWGVLVVVVMVLLAGQWERFRPYDLLGALAAGLLAASMLAGRWENVNATASALRWWSTSLFLLVSTMIWGRAWLARWVVRMGWRYEPAETDGLALRAGVTVFVMTLVPLLSMTISVACMELAGNPILGPAQGSYFARIGVVGSYVPPLVLIAVGLVGYAVRERSSAFAFAAGLVMNLAATVGFVLEGVAGAGVSTLAPEFWTRLVLLNASVASAAALTWMDSVAVWHRRLGAEGGEWHRPADDRLLTALTALGIALNGLVLVAGTLAVFLEPVPAPGGMNAAIAGPWGWVAIGISAWALAVWAHRSRWSITPDALGVGVLCVADFLALGLAVRDLGDWRTYHGVLAGQAIAGAFLLLWTWRLSGLQLATLAGPWRAAVVRWASVAMVLVVVFALRAYWSDPQSPWWTVGGLAMMAPMAAALAVWARRPSLVGFSGVLLNLAATFWWFATPWSSGSQDFDSALADLININVIALALPAPVWLWVHRRWLRDDGSGPPWLTRVETVPFQRVAAWIALAALALWVGIGLLGDAAESPSRPIVLLGWGAFAASSMAMGAGLWDDRSRGTVAGLYLLGLCAMGWAVHQYHLPPPLLAWIGTIVLSAYSVLTSYAWGRRAGLRAFADRLGIPRPDADDPLAGLSWLAPANLALAAGVLALAFGTILTEPETLKRSLAAHAVLAEVLATGLLAQGERRLRLQFAALGVGVLGVVAWAWAWIAPDAPSGVLDRLVVVLVALVGTSVLYGLGLTKLFRRETEWTRAARRLVPGLLALAGVVLALVLGTEAFERLEGGDVAMSFAAIVAVAAALLAAVVGALVAALVPGSDPLSLPERGRMAYVYGCEVLLVLLGLHLRLTMPWLFGGFFARYRPLIVLGIAFVGVGLSELFRRQRRVVLAEPLERTGALLPALPLLGALWSAPRPGEDSTFLVLAGVLYTVLSLLRSSLGFGALAALAYNGALWALLGRREGFGLFEHPQLWVIPPALCTLVGAYLNRDRLSESQTTSIRYATCLAIYLSSTGDIILTGVAQAPWLPLVLGGLALVGIFAGITLRVRGFLFLGLAFLGLSLFTIIWYAAVDLRQTWLWSATGIVAGILILALFALFEKKRQEVLRVVDQFKEWNA